MNQSIDIFAHQYINMRKVICKMLKTAGLKHEIVQYRWGRKLYKGHWFLVENCFLGANEFWMDERATRDSNFVIIKSEHYEN